MAQCKMCGQKGFFLSVNANGLCKSCNPIVVMDVKQRARIVKDCMKLIDKSKNIETRLSRCDLLVRHAQSLLEYEHKGIPTVSPYPSELLTRYTILRTQLVEEENKRTSPHDPRPDWKKSKAHLLLLSKFIHAQQPEYFAESGDWKHVLGEPPKQTIKQFVDEGLLITAGLNDLLSYRYKVNELKDMLKQKGLSASGRKDEMIQRLVQIDPDGMKKAVTGLTYLKCTQSGHEIAEQYLVSEQEKRARVEKQVMEYLTNRKFKEACLTVAAYEAEQVFIRGIGVDWKHYNPNRDLEILNAIWGSKPRIISHLGDEALEALRIGAAMMVLWGDNKASRWLPTDLETGLPFDNNVAARMVLYHAQNSIRIKEYYDARVVKYVEILAAPDSCESCKKLATKRYRLNEVPVLPNEECTHEIGCRCVVIPVVK